MKLFIGEKVGNSNARRAAPADAEAASVLAALLANAEASHGVNIVLADGESIASGIHNGSFTGVSPSRTFTRTIRGADGKDVAVTDPTTGQPVTGVNPATVWAAVFPTV